MVLICSPLRFYTDNDEDLCFQWMKKNKSIKEIKGVGRELHLIIKSNKIPNKDLLDLMGLFDRYKFDSKQLKAFINETNEDLLGNYFKVYPRREPEVLLNDELLLECTPLWFYTKNDGNLMFRLMDKIKCIRTSYGIGQVIYLVIDLKKISKKYLEDLKTLFVRYKFDEGQLKGFISLIRIRALNPSTLLRIKLRRTRQVQDER